MSEKEGAQRSIASFFLPKGQASTVPATNSGDKKRKAESDALHQSPLKRLKKQETAEPEPAEDLDAMLQDEEEEEQRPPKAEKGQTLLKLAPKEPKEPKESKEQDKPKKKEETAKAEPEAKADDIDEVPDEPDNVGDAPTYSWPKGEPAPFLVVARAFSEVTKTRAKLVHIKIMRELFRSLILQTPADLVPTLYIATNQLGPAYEGLELGVGEQIIKKAICEATGKSLQNLNNEYKKLGDLGLVAQASGSTVRTLKAPKPLTIRGVFETLHQIATESGNQSIKKKQDRIRHLLVCCRESEAQFIVKALQGKMRINLGPKSIAAGLAHAFAYIESKGKRPSDERLKQAVTLINAAFSELPDWAAVTSAARQHGLDELPEHCHLTVGVPVNPMLAQPTKGTQEILERLQGHSVITAEFKYDGERAQIHMLPGGKVKIYSRNLEDNTGKFPDIIANLPKALKPGVESFILDSEAVAFDRETMKILPFQILSTRSRKEVAIDQIKVQVCLFVFDLMYLNGQSLIKKTLQERRQILKESFQEIPGQLQYATAKEFEDVEDLPAYLTEAVENQCEGLMVKSFITNADYRPSDRSYSWLKLKKDYMDGVTDSVDLVPIGAWEGKGKRTGVYGAYLLAVYNDEDEEYQSVCKIGTGFSDAQLAELTTTLKKSKIDAPRPYYRYGENFKCDVWFDPITVWEVLAADLSISPVHKGGIGLVAPNKGIGLRFPRFIRIRDDKSPENATTATQIADMYRNQKISHTAGAGGDDEDDY